MSKYSAISVLDRVSLDKVIGETLDPTYEDNLEIVRLGHVAQVGYMMTGNIMRTSSGYSMQINVTDTTPNATTIASHSGTYTVAQFDNHSAIQRASLDLLTQMGVELTSTAINELGRASSRESITAQTALAQGITAQRMGQTVEAISHYFDASSLEVTAAEAISRLSTATTTIATGSLGTQVRNDIQQRNEWIKLIEETRKFLANNNYYNLAELYYSPRLDLASINYTAETANLTFPVQIRLNNERANAITKIVNDIHNGLEATGRQQQWGINVSVDSFLYSYEFDFELIDERGKVISSTSTPNSIILFYDGKPQRNITLYSKIIYQSFFSSRTLLGNKNSVYGRDIYYSIGSFRINTLVVESFEYIRLYDRDSLIYFDVVGTLSPSDVLNISGMVSNLFMRTGLNGLYHDGFQRDVLNLAEWLRSPFFNAKAAAITDELSIRLKNITVYQMQKNGRSKRIQSGNNIIPVRTETF